MSDLLQSAKLFEVSARLQTASTYLLGVAEDKQPGDAGQQALKWAGNFLSQVDWASKVKPSGEGREGLAVQAASARPAFYRVLMRLLPVFEEHGINTSGAVSSFLSRVYKTLVAGGTDRNGASPEHLRLAATLLERLAQSVLSQLSDEGTPEKPPLVASRVC